MKLLFDENLSFKLCAKMQDVFPGSKHVRDLGLEQAEDIEIWEFSKNKNFVIVTKDADFNDLSVMWGYPPYIVWLRTGNTRVRQIESITPWCRLPPVEFSLGTRPSAAINCPGVQTVANHPSLLVLSELSENCWRRSAKNATCRI